MTTLALLVLVLACPLMMIFMMRGTHGGEDRTESGHGPQADRRTPHSVDVKFTDARIEQLEREMAAPRLAQDDQPRSAPGRRP